MMLILLDILQIFLGIGDFSPEQDEAKAIVSKFCKNSILKSSSNQPSHPK